MSPQASPRDAFLSIPRSYTPWTTRLQGEGLVYGIEDVIIEEVFGIEVASNARLLVLEREPRDD